MDGDLKVYIGNLRSLIYHKSSCMYVYGIKEDNRVDLKVFNGFKPCKICKP